MKIKTITRSKVENKKQHHDEAASIQRNLDPTIHPFAKEREYTRALNAAKLEKMFAKPFICALDSHSDGVFCLRRHPSQLKTFISGAFDGEIKIWNLSKREELWGIEAHKGCVRGVCVTNDEDSFLSCSDDKTIKLWRLKTSETNGGKNASEPLTVWSSTIAFTDVDCQRNSSKFVTSGTNVDLWDIERSQALSTYNWGVDSHVSTKFNPVETDVFATLGVDRGILLYDVRTNSMLRKCVTPMRSNAIAWNPMEAFNFVVANENHHLYTFDMRNLNAPKMVHKDHVGAVLGVDFAPTGREFVTGSYDKTIRIFGYNSAKSRTVYHTSRMQRVFSVQYSGDASFIISGSDDTNVRVWKAHASDPLRVVSGRERKSIQYRKKLRQRFAHMPEVARIERHQHVPKTIFKTRKTYLEVTEAARRREENMRKHSKPETAQERSQRKASLRQQSVVEELE